jgi:hypothetical protein
MTVYPAVYPAYPVECEACRAHFLSLNETRFGAIRTAMTWYVASYFRAMSPMEALSEYLEAFHVSGHVEHMQPSMSEAARISALHDEGPEGLRVTPEMKAQVSPHIFEALPNLDACAECGLPAKHAMHPDGGQRVRELVSA